MDLFPSVKFFPNCPIKIAGTQNNGFVLFGKRKLDKDETMIQGEELMQLLKYIHT